MYLNQFLRFLRTLLKKKPRSVRPRELIERVVVISNFLEKRRAGLTDIGYRINCAYIVYIMMLFQVFCIFNFFHLSPVP